MLEVDTHIHIQYSMKTLWLVPLSFRNRSSKRSWPSSGTWRRSKRSTPSLYSWTPPARKTCSTQSDRYTTCSLTPMILWLGYVVIFKVLNNPPSSLLLFWNSTVNYVVFQDINSKLKGTFGDVLGPLTKLQVELWELPSLIFSYIHFLFFIIHFS